jgi:phosphoribosyl 1,2-cyclic phosphodiesterase
MLVRFWGTRGSLPVALKADAVAGKIARALVEADGRRFADVESARGFAEDMLGFSARATYGGASACVEIEGGDGSFVVCDMGSGLREFGLRAAGLTARGERPKLYHIFMSHLHWDHIMGFPFFGPAFDPSAKIVFHGCHAEMETALRRQQEEISFPVAFDWLAADISFDILEPGRRYEIAGMAVTAIKQRHSNDSYGYRFEATGGTVVYSTDSEHKADDMEGEAAFEAFFHEADLVVFDTMYSLADSVTMKADWGHSSNIVAVDMCLAAQARRLALFHHEPTYSDEDLDALLAETVRYEALSRDERSPLHVLCSYDGLEIAL